ncbi:MAG: sugar phosphate isomerase/epimerase family protein [Promethearchaeota archaeon]
MRLAVNQATLMKTRMQTFLDAISKAKFEGVELRRDETFSYLKDHTISDLINLLEDFNLRCVTFNAVELFSLCPESEFNRILEYTERLMNIGTQIGCNTIIAVPSFLENDLSENQIYKKTIERLLVLAELAEKYDFRLGFEPLGFPNCSVRKVSSALKIITDERLPEMGLVIDTFHFFVGENHINELEKIGKDKLWLVHFNDAIEKPYNELKDSDRLLPCQGLFNLELFINKLKEIGYDDWISLELFNEEIWKQDPYQVAIDSMKSIKKIL